MLTTTPPITSDELKKLVIKAKSLEAAVMLIYFHSRKCYTATDIYTCLKNIGLHHHIITIGKAINTLYNKNEIIRPPMFKEGLQGDKENYWQLNKKKHPLVTSSQQNLFDGTTV